MVSGQDGQATSRVGHAGDGGLRTKLRGQFVFRDW